MALWADLTVRLFFGRAHVAYFSDQGLNPCPLHCKPGILTTGLPGKPQILLSFSIALAALETDVYFSVQEGKGCQPEGPV